MRAKSERFIHIATSEVVVMSRRQSRPIVLLIAVLLAACQSAAPGSSSGSSGQPSTYRVIYLTPNLNNGFQAVTKLFFEQHAKKAAIDLKTLNANDDAALQVNQLDDAIAQHPNGIIIGGVETATILPGVEKARAAGIKVIDYDRPLPETKVDFACVTDTVKLGATSADQVADLLTKKNGEAKGTVLEIMGDALESYTRTVRQGFDEQMQAKYPKVELIVKNSPGWTAEAAATNADDVLTANPKLDAIFLHGDFRAPAVVAVLQAKHYQKGQIVFVSTDGASEGLEAIRQGWVAVTVQQPTPEQASGCWQFIPDLLAGKKPPAGGVDIDGLASMITDESYGPYLRIPGQVVNATNVDDPKLWGNMKVTLE